MGSSLAYAALIRESAREVALYDIDAPRVEAEVLDLAHGTPFTGASRITGGADLDVVTGSNVVVVTAGAKQKPGQTRLELAGVNVGIIRDLMPKLVERCRASSSSSTNEPSSSSSATRSRAVSLPAARCRSTALADPAWVASSSRRSRSASFPAVV